MSLSTQPRASRQAMWGGLHQVKHSTRVTSPVKALLRYKTPLCFWLEPENCEALGTHPVALGALEAVLVICGRRCLAGRAAGGRGCCSKAAVPISRPLHNCVDALVLHTCIPSQYLLQLKPCVLAQYQVLFSEVHSCTWHSFVSAACTVQPF